MLRGVHQPGYWKAWAFRLGAGHEAAQWFRENSQTRAVVS